MMATRTTTTRTTIASCGASGVGNSSPNTSFDKIPLLSVFNAYFDCRRHKRNSFAQLAFEQNLEQNLVDLWHELRAGKYEIGRSTAFVVTHPKVREVWAADFRDRIVHHLIYNEVRNIFERSFIYDSYACIPGRGVHFGVNRVARFARSITKSWSKPAYVLKADISNFFNSIDHNVLLKLLLEKVTDEWLRELLIQNILHDPRPLAIRKSRTDTFAMVPRHKSFLHAPPGKGLPIGNLTSQFYANVYLNELDQFAKHKLHAKYYGRYVDDFIMFHEDPKILNEWYEDITLLVEHQLKLKLHPGKKWLNLADKGIDFCGAVIKPGRTYIRRSTVSNCKKKIYAWERSENPFDVEEVDKLCKTLNSYLGMLRQVDGFNTRKKLCNKVTSLWIKADKDYTKITEN